MAQLGNTQREPSMEEILASIRRIIEDSDLQKPEEAALAVRPANDDASAVSSELLSGRALTTAVVARVGGLREPKIGICGLEPTPTRRSAIEIA